MSWFCLLMLLGNPQPVAAAEVAPGLQSDGHDPHAQLERILDQPLFQRWRLRQERAATQPHKFHFLEVVRLYLRDALSTVVDYLKKLFGRLRFLNFPNFGGGSNFMAVLKLLIWCGAAFIVFYFLLLLYKLFVQKSARVSRARVLSREEVHTALERGDALAMGGSEWLREAQRLAQAGQLRAVYRAMYLALLSSLHSAGKIEYRRQRTNWTYVNRFRGPDPERTIFFELTELFDDVWYGFKGVNEAELNAVRAKVSTLVRKDAGHV